MSITLNVSIIPVKYISAKLNIHKCSKRSLKKKHIERTLQHIYTIGKLVSKHILKIPAPNTTTTDNQHKNLFFLGGILNP